MGWSYIFFCESLVFYKTGGSISSLEEVRLSVLLLGTGRLLELLERLFIWEECEVELLFPTENGVSKTGNARQDLEISIE